MSEYSKSTPKGYEIFFVDANNQRIGQVDDFNRLEISLRFNDVGKFSLELPGDSPAADWVTWKGGVQIVRDGQALLSGLVRKVQRKLDKSNNDLVISGPDENTFLTERVVYPEKSGNFAAQAYDIQSGAAETVLKYYAGANAGPDALLARRVLTIEADGERGSTITGRGRFQDLLEFLKELTLQGTSELGFRVWGREFQVYEPVDRRLSVIFSLELGTLTQFESNIEAAKFNYLICGAAGEATSRTFREQGDSASIVRYGRMESFRDRRDTDDAAEIYQTLNEELTRNAERFSVRFTTADTAGMRALEDWTLGDQATVVVDGQPIQEAIREITIKVDRNNGEQILPTVGTADAINALSGVFGSVFENVRRFERRINHLEVQ